MSIRANIKMAANCRRAHAKGQCLDCRMQYISSKRTCAGVLGAGGLGGGKQNDRMQDFRSAVHQKEKCKANVNGW